MRTIYMRTGHSEYTAICQREIRSYTQRNRLSDHTVLHSALSILTCIHESFFYLRKRKQSITRASSTENYELPFDYGFERSKS